MASEPDRPAYMPAPLGAEPSPASPESTPAAAPAERDLPPPRPFYIPDEGSAAPAAPRASLILLEAGEPPVPEIAAALAPHWRRSPVEGAREIARCEGLLWETDDPGAARAAAEALRGRGIGCAAIDLKDLPVDFAPEIFESAHIHVEDAVFVCAETEHRFPLAAVRAILTGRVEAPLLAKPPLEAHIVAVDPPRILTGSEVKYHDRRFVSLEAFARRLAERCPHAAATFNREFADAERLHRHRRWLMLRSMVG